MIKNFYTDNKITKNINYKFIGQDIKKIDFFKAISNDKKNNDLNHKKINKIKIKDNANAEKNDKNSSRSEHLLITNYLKKKMNTKKSNVYMKGILKIWKNKAKNITKSIHVKVVNQKIINGSNSFFNKYYNYYVEKK